MQRNALLLIVLLAVISRLPQLLSPHLVLDGDECIMGLMSKHFIEGKTLPFFFYGQTYGFAFVEVLAISGGYLLAGVSEYSVKLSLLALWITGVFFFFKALQSLGDGDKRLALIMTVILILAPAWAVWSMKARGGYITSFTLSAIVMYLSLKPGTRHPLIFAICGMLLVVIYFSQPMWLPGLLPFVLFALISRGALKKSAGLVAGVSIAVLLFLLAKPSGSGYWRPNVFTFEDIRTVSDVAHNIYNNLLGYYYLWAVYKAPLATRLFVWFFLAVFGASVCMACYRLYIAPPGQKLLITAALLSVAGTISYGFFIYLGYTRYALPFTGYALILIYVAWAGHGKTLVAKAAFIPFAVLGVASLYLFKDYRADVSRAELVNAVNTMEERHITHIFCTGPLLQWQVMFYSNEKTIARFHGQTDRYIPYIIGVDSMFRTAPERTAVFGLRSKTDGIPPNVCEQVGDSYFLYVNPAIELMQQTPFQF